MTSPSKTAALLLVGGILAILSLSVGASGSLRGIYNADFDAMTAEWDAIDKTWYGEQEVFTPDADVESTSRDLKKEKNNNNNKNTAKTTTSTGTVNFSAQCYYTYPYTSKAYQRTCSDGGISTQNFNIGIVNEGVVSFGSCQSMDRCMCAALPIAAAVRCNKCRPCCGGSCVTASSCSSTGVKAANGKTYTFDQVQRNDPYKGQRWMEQLGRPACA